MVSARAAITKYIDWVFFEQQKFILSHFWRPESPRSRFLQGLVPGESSLFGLQTAAFFCVSISPTGLGPNPMTSVNLLPLLTGPVFKYRHIGD